MLERYSPLTEPDGSFGAHALVAKLIDPGSRVLDLGCGGGFLAERLVRKNCVVTGVEIDPRSVERARQVCNEVIEGDVESLPVSSLPRVDVVVLADVLEHLKNPEAALSRIRPLIDPNGAIVASIPNVAYASVRIRLLFGHFDYRASGIMDRTHLRFFTRASILHMFREAGYLVEVFEASTTMPGVRWLGNPSHLRKPVALVGRILPTLLASQFVVRARPGSPMELGRGLPAQG